MAKTPASTLITDLAKRVDRDSTDTLVVRPAILRQLNISQQSVLQDQSLRFMLDNGTVSLLNNASSAAVPTTIDDSKAMALGRSGGDGKLQYVPPDEWFITQQDTYRQPAGELLIPSFYTIVQVAGARTFLFKPSNTSGGTLAIPYLAQLIPVAMTDAGNSFSMLPEGFEDTLLLDHAEIEWRRFNGDPIQQAPSYLLDRVRDKQAQLYNSYRTTKEMPVTDREQPERKIAREKYAPEKP